MSIKTILKIATNKFTIIAVLFITCSVLAGLYKRANQERKRVKSNQELLLTQLGEAKESLFLTQSEFTQVKKTDQRLITILQDSLQIKDKQIQSLKRVKQTTRVKVKTVLRDSVVYTFKDSLILDTVRVVQTFNWNDAWTSIDGVVDQDSVEIDYQSNDSIYVTVHWDKQGKFLPCVFGRKVYKANVTNSNPNSDLFMDRNIEVIRRNRRER